MHETLADVPSFGRQSDGVPGVQVSDHRNALEIEHNSLIAEPHPTSAPCVLSIEYTDRPLYYMMDSTIFVMIFIMDEWEKSSYWYFYRFMINS